MTTLSDDIYKVIEGEIKVDDNLYNELAQNIAHTIRNRLSDTEPVRKTLGLSSVGKPLRKLWYDFHSDIELVKPTPSMRLKFLFGDIIEDLLLWLVKVSGHTVTDRQREVNCCGVTGHIDSIIDGEVVDIEVRKTDMYDIKKALGELYETQDHPGICHIFDIVAAVLRQHFCGQDRLPIRRTDIAAVPGGRYVVRS